MGFLVPAFLLGAAAIAVPVIVHLIHRQKTDAIEFPSLMFVSRVPHRTVERRRIRNWPLLLLRCLALLLIVGAFARPFAERDLAAAAAFELAREIVIVVDHSNSMARGARWDAAVGAARDAIAGVRPEDRATIVVFGTSAEAVTEPTSDRARLNAALDRLAPTDAATSYGPALRLAHSIVARSERPRAAIILISDMQRYGWDAESTAALPAGAAFTPIHVGDAAAGAAVTNVAFERELFAGRERIAPRATLHNFSAAARDARATLHLDGRPIESRSVALAAGESGVAEFAAVTVPDAGGRFAVTLEGERESDGLRFAVTPGRRLSVLVIEAGAGGAPSLYLERALAIGGSPGFAVERRTSAQLRAADLEGRHVVVLNDAPFPGGEAGRRLVRWVRDGGGLVVALGERGGGGWVGDAAALLPGSIGRVVDRLDGGGGRLGWVDASHAALEPIGGTGFADARFFRYRPVEGAAGENVIARYDDGRVALAERRVDAGRVVLLGTSLDVSWNDLALQPVFLPLAHQLVKHAAAWDGERDWFTVGDVVAVTRRGSAGDDAVVTTPGGRRAGVENGFVRLDQAGFYEVQSGEASWSIAANVARAEADPATLAVEDVAARVAAGSAADGSRSAGVLNPVGAADWEQRQAFWWYLLLVALLLLAVESMLAGRLTRRSAVS
jgi:hypothetical protein